MRGLQRQGLLERTRPETLNRYYRAVENMAGGQSLSEASRRAGISAETVRRIDTEHGLLSKVYEGRTFKGWAVEASATYPILTTDGDYFDRVQLDAKGASIVGRYWNDVKAAVNEGEWRRLDRWRDVEVRDVQGNVYRLNTDADELAFFFQQMTDAQRESFNRAFDSERIRIRRAA